MLQPPIMSDHSPPRRPRFACGGPAGSPRLSSPLNESAIASDASDEGEDGGTKRGESFETRRRRRASDGQLLASKFSQGLSFTPVNEVPSPSMLSPPLLSAASAPAVSWSGWQTGPIVSPAREKERRRLEALGRTFPGFTPINEPSQPPLASSVPIIRPPTLPTPTLEQCLNALAFQKRHHSRDGTGRRGSGGSSLSRSSSLQTVSTAATSVGTGLLSAGGTTTTDDVDKTPTNAPGRSQSVVEPIVQTRGAIAGSSFAARSRFQQKQRALSASEETGGLRARRAKAAMRIEIPIPLPQVVSPPVSPSSSSASSCSSDDDDSEGSSPESTDLVDDLFSARPKVGFGFSKAGRRAADLARKPSYAAHLHRLGDVRTKARGPPVQPFKARAEPMKARTFSAPVGDKPEAWTTYVNDRRQLQAHAETTTSAAVRTGAAGKRVDFSTGTPPAVADVGSLDPASASVSAGSGRPGSGVFTLTPELDAVPMVKTSSKTWGWMATHGL